MTQFSLKLIALLCMLCDHFSKVVLTTGVFSSVLGLENHFWLRTMLTVVGRIALPIFAWFTAEACHKTKNPKKYLLRLAIFSIVSEVPFQLCFYAATPNALSLGCHNVIFTMLLGAAGILFGQYLLQKRVPAIAAVCIPAMIAIALGYMLHTDYNAWGVALIIGLYYLKDQKSRLIFLACWITVFQLIWHGWNGEVLVWLSRENDYRLILQWIGGLFSLGFLATYNRQKGRSCKWLFYVFYPVHLLILYLLRCLILF